MDASSQSCMLCLPPYDVGCMIKSAKSAAIVFAEPTLSHESIGVMPINGRQRRRGLRSHEDASNSASPRGRICKRPVPKAFAVQNDTKNSLPRWKTWGKVTKSFSRTKAYFPPSDLRAEDDIGRSRQQRLLYFGFLPASLVCSA